MANLPNNAEARKFLTFKYANLDLTVKNFMMLMQEGKIIFDPEVQRKLSPKRKREIARYIFNGLSGISNGAFFAPIVGSYRENGTLAILDGQHRSSGLMHALIVVKEYLDLIERIRRGHQLTNKELKQLEGKTPEEFVQLQEKFEDWLEVIGDSNLPIMTYVDLSKEQEQQAFHDMNNLGMKVSKSLSISMNHNDHLVRIAKMVCSADEMQHLVQPLSAGGRLSSDYLFLFSTIYQSIVSFVGKGSTLSDEEPAEEVRAFFDIFVKSIPRDAFLHDLYRHAGTLQGIAAFANRMKQKQAEGVCWKKTLEDALSKVTFKSTNTDFVRYGGALLDDEKKIVFSGSKGAISVVVKTLEALSRRLNKDGEEVLSAYQSGKTEEPINFVSDEEAQRVAEEAARHDTAHDADDDDALLVNDSAEGQLSKAEEAILQAIRESEGQVLNMSHKQLAEKLQFAKSSIGEALKKLETKGLIQVETLENQSRAYRIAG